MGLSITTYIYFLFLDQYILPNPESIHKQDIQRDHLMEGRQQADVSYMRCMQEVVSLHINESNSDESPGILINSRTCLST